MTPPVTISENGYVVTLTYEAVTYQLRFKPNVLKCHFECTSVTRDGNEVTSLERYQLIQVGEREVYALLKRSLSPPPRYAPRTTLLERVELSFALTLRELAQPARLALMPLDETDMHMLRRLTSTIAERLRDTNIQARAEQRTVPADTFYDIKSEVLRDWQEENRCSNELRDFYSSVLGRVFAWKKGRVPYPQYIEAMKYLPGIKLAFGQ